jgi:uncharacterized membrane protein YbhN (UPF0104 family)
VAESPARPRWWQTVKRIAGALLGLLLLLGALWVLRHDLGSHSVKEVVRALAGLPRSRVMLALLATILGYAVLSAQDLLGLKFLGVKLPLARAALAGFAAFAFANNLPLAVVTGGAVRARFYAGAKVPPGDTTSLVLFNTVTYALGLLTAAGLAFTLEPRALPGLVKLPLQSTLPLGIVALGLLALLLVWSVRGGPTLRIAKQTIKPTPIGLTLARLGVSLLDWLFSAAALYVLLPGSDFLRFGGFLGVFMLGQLAGLLAQLPGGIGVFEAVVLRMVRNTIPVPAALGALFAYRVIYFLLPLLVAATLLLIREIRRAGHRSAKR